MSQKDPVKTASDFWSASGITSYFQNLICCGCAERKDKPTGPTYERNSHPNGNYTSTLDDSWMTEEYYEIPGATLPSSNTATHEVNCRNDQGNSHDPRENLRPRTLETGKGVTYHESDDGDDDALSVSSKVSTRKKISKPKATSKIPTTNARSNSKGRNPWQPAEDETLKSLIKQHGKRWSIISKMMGGTRNGKQIRDRWMNKLDPSIQEKVWTPEEDRIVVMLWQQFGNHWSEIAKHLEGRTESMVKNRYYSHLAKKVIANESPTMSLNSSKTVSPTARGPTQLNGQPINQTGNEFGSQVIRFPNQPSAQFYENGQIAYNGHQYVQPQNPGVQYLYSLPQVNTNPAAHSSLLVSDDQFLVYDKINSVQNPKIPLLSIVDPLFSNELELKLNLVPSIRASSYLDFDKVPSNNSHRSRPNSNRSRPKHSESYNSLDDQKEDKTMLYNLLNLRNNYEQMPNAIPETDETRSDIISPNPYGYENMNGTTNYGNQNGHNFYGNTDFDQNSPHETTYSEQIRKRFGPGGASDEASEFSADFKDMDIEGQIDKLVFMLDSRTVSTASQVPNLSKQDSAISNETDKNFKVNVLKRREMTLKYLLERTHQEIQKNDDPSYYRQSSIESSVLHAI